jgi:S-adenosylmethionine decarboxylase
MKVSKKSLSESHFGLHLTLDLYGCDSKILASRRLVEQFLNLLTRRLQMRKLYGPKVVWAFDNQLKDPGGWSGFVIIQESHFSIHTFPKRRFASMDVYSCRDFDYLAVIRFSKKFFMARSAEKNIIVRGKRYPQKNLL